MHSRRIFWHSRLIWVLASYVFAVQSLDIRSEQTQAQCSADYNWASNSLNLSPCLLAAFVWGTCFAGNWDVPQLPQGQSYSNPNSTTANLCTCSWAAYNLISACTACQGFDSAVASWAAYEQSCGGFLTDTYFPSNVTLPVGTAIPSWAGTDPRTWSDGRFDTAQAQLLAEENKPDIVQGQITSNSKKSKPPIGAIIGGVVGVAVVVGTLAFLFLRRHKRQCTDEGGARTYSSINGSSVPDLSRELTFFSQRRMSPVDSPNPATHYPTGTIHTHTSGVHSVPYASAYTTPIHTMSPRSPAYVVNCDEVIEPLLLRPTLPPMSMLTSTARGTPETLVVQEHYAPETRERPRSTPPAYSPPASPASAPEPATQPFPGRRNLAPGHCTRRREIASADPQSSSDGANDSVSIIDELVDRIGLVLPLESIDGSTMDAHTVSTGQSMNVISRQKKNAYVSNPDEDVFG